MAAINDALAGTSGTPSGTNKFVTNSDPRLSGGGSGTVTNIATTAPITGGPITTTGTLGIDLGAGGSLAVSGSKLVRAALTGDVTASADSNATTLAAVGSAATTGDASHVAQVTTDTKGRVTSATAVAIQIAESQVTNLTTDLAGKVPTTRTITAGAGLTGGGDLSADRTIALTTPVTVANGGTGTATASANTVFSGPTSGGAAAPAFRALVQADLPTILARTTTASASYTITGTNDQIIEASAGGQAITLPAASGRVGQIVAVVDTSLAIGFTAGSTIVQRAGSDTLEGYTALALAWRGQALVLVSDGTSAWRAISDWVASPSGLSGLTLWYEADYGVTLVSSAVSSWTDRSTTGAALAQATAGLRPTLPTYNEDGKPEVLFNGGGQYMTASDSAAYKTATVFAGLAFRTTSSAVANAAVCGYPYAATHISPFFDWVIYQNSSTTFSFRIGTDDTAGVTVLNMLTPRILLYGTNTRTERVNPPATYGGSTYNQSGTAGLSVTYANATGFRVGANAAGSESAPVGMRAICIYSTELSAQDRAELSRYLSRWMPNVTPRAGTSR